MPRLLPYQSYTMLAAGGDLILSLDQVVDIYILTANGGSITLADNITISPTGTPKIGHEFKFSYSGGVNLNTHQVEIFGTELTLDQALNKQQITCLYDGVIWIVTITKDSTEGNQDIIGEDIVDESILTAAIADDAITLAKMANLAARGYLIRGGVSGAPEGFNAVTSGNLVLGNGTDIVSQAVTGDVTINGSGVTTIGAGKVVPTMLSFTLADQLLEASLTIPTASILTLNGTPLTIVVAPGADKYIEVVSASASITFVSAPYATNTTLQLISEGADIAVVQNTSILIASITKNTRFNNVTSVAAGSTQIITNAALQVKVGAGNPITGDSDIIVKVLYRIVEI